MVWLDNCSRLIKLANRIGQVNLNRNLFSLEFICVGYKYLLIFHEYKGTLLLRPHSGFLSKSLSKVVYRIRFIKLSYHGEIRFSVRRLNSPYIISKTDSNE